MDRREFPQSFAALGAAVAIPMDVVTANVNALVENVPIRFVAVAWGKLHD
jgi:hypothetical protein